MQRKPWIPAVALALAAWAPLSANESTWSENAARNWDVAAWSPAGIPDGAGWIINIDRSSHTGNRNLTINTTSRTVGEIHAFGVPTSSRSNTLAASGDATLTLDNGTSPARVTNEGLGNFTISAPVLLVSNLELKNSPNVGAGQFLTLSGTVGSADAGLKTITTIASDYTPANLNDHRIVFSGSITDGAGQVAVIHNSGNNLNIQTRTNTFSGGLTINSGAVQVSGDGDGKSYGDGALGAANSAITFNGGSLVFTSADAEIVISERLTTLNAGGGTISANSASGVVTWNGNVVGAGALTKGGAGTVILANANNAYQGGTAVNGGTLVAAHNSSLGTGAVTVNAGTLSLASGVSLANNIRLDFDGKLTSTTSATLLGRVSGIGTIGSEAGALNFAAGSVLAPGGELPGILNVEGEVMLQAGSVFQWQLAALSEAAAGQSFSQIVIAEGGYLNIANGAMLDLVFGNGLAPHGGDAFWSENHSWLIVAGNNVSNGLFDIDNSAWSDVGWFYTTLVDGGVALNWTAAAIPEPSTYAAIFGGLALIGVMIMRRRRA